MKLQENLTRQCLRCLLLLFVITALLSQALGQVIDGKGLSRVPSHLRTRLVERLNLYLEYQQTQQYSKLFDLLPGDYIQERKLTKESFINENEKIDSEGRRDIPIKLRVDRVSRIHRAQDKESYRIIFKGRFGYRNRIVEDNLYFDADWENGDWFVWAYHIESFAQRILVFAIS